MIKRFGIGTMLAVVTTVLIWSTTFAALVAALRHFSPEHLLFLRWTLTAVLFAAYAVATRMRMPHRADMPKIALAGLLGFAAYQLLLVNGQTGVSATMAGFLVNLSPIFTTVIAALLGREAARWNTWIGLAVCTAGLVVMAQGRGGLGDLGPSAGLIVLAALSFALYTLVSRPLLSTYTPLEVTTYALIAGAIPFVVFAPGSLSALASASAVDMGNLLFLALFPGGIAYVLWARSVQGLNPALASRFLYLIPVLGLPVAWMWVGEVPQLLTVVGGLVTIAGVALSSLRPAMPAASPKLIPLAAATPATEAA